MYFKIFNEDDNHHGFQYQDGLNTDSNEFEPNGSCIADGLYFTDEKHICEFFRYGPYIRQVEIPDGETNITKDPDGNKWRSKSLFIHKRRALDEVETWQWMIENNVDITAGNNYAINLASENGHLAIVELLLKHGADCTAKDNYAIRMASRNGHLAVVELLLKHGVDCTALDNFAIRMASENGHLAIVELLLKHGADCTTDDNYAIRMASENGHLVVVELLKRHGAKL